MLAHRSQLWAVPDGIDDRTAVLLEPLATAIHSVFRARIPEGADVLVIGSGTVGLLTQVALRRYAQPGRVIVAAKHTAQRAAAKMAGADEVVRPEHALKAVRRAGHAVKLYARAGPGLPARRRRRGVRVHGLRSARSTWRCAPRRPAGASW